MPSTTRTALVLTAGLGTRLHPLTALRAKPAVPVAGEPLVRRIARWLVANGVNDLVLNLHHLPETITAVVGDGADVGARVRYSWEQPLLLGSAGGPRQALAIVGDETFFLVNGDTLTDLDLSGLESAHRASGALVTMALTRNHEPDRYGGVVLDGGRVTGFVRRGAPEAINSCHFIGIQIVAAEAFRRLSPGQAANTLDVYGRLIAQRPGAVCGYLCDAAFWDVGTIADYVRTSRALGETASSSIVWAGATVDPGADLDACIVTDGVHVPSGARHRREVLLRGPDGQIMGIPWTDDRG